MTEKKRRYIESMYYALMDLLQSDLHQEVAASLNKHDVQLGVICKYILTGK